MGCRFLDFACAFGLKEPIVAKPGVYSLRKYLMYARRCCNIENVEYHLELFIDL